MQLVDAAHDARPANWPFLAFSALLHALALLALGFSLSPLPPFEIRLPDSVEMGLVDGDPGPEGAPAPAATPPPEPEPPRPVPEPKIEPEPQPASTEVMVVTDAGVTRKPDASVVPNERAVEGGSRQPSSDSRGTDDALALGAGGSGRGGAGDGLGFGAGGFGNGRGGPLGAVIGLHADLDAIRKTSLILETRALLELIPQWRNMLAGSGLQPVDDFSRLFIATPSLDRSQLVLVAKSRGGAARVLEAASDLAHAAGKQTSAANGTVAWHSRGPTPRLARMFDDGQVIIARPTDVERAEAVGAALARRHAHQPGMERRQGSAALLAMYEGEAVALSIEGVETYVKGHVDFAPRGIRLSLRHLDQYHATLVAYGYYDSVEAATQAEPEVDALRTAWIDHPRSRYLGLSSALDEAEVAREGDTVMVNAKLTMHQMRYLLGYVSRALNPRK